MAAVGLARRAARLTSAQVEQIRRTVRRTPEVVVKVLPRASNDLKAVGKHMDYIGRKGELELETDDGERLSGRIGRDLWMTGTSTSTTCDAKGPSPPRKADSRRSSSISSCSRCRRERPGQGVGGGAKLRTGGILGSTPVRFRLAYR